LPVDHIIVFEMISSCWSRPATVLEWRVSVAYRRQYKTQGSDRLSSSRLLSTDIISTIVFT